MGAKAKAQGAVASLPCHPSSATNAAKHTKTSVFNIQFSFP